ncbi:CPBP family intramembrane glutamic endopeptidase [Flammeovirga aprica]|uniref:CPBP family intramembrane metalloprotease n=1 Tax=Flammeovirga aprica JL-4 TaxID=694437 RepID=A0A7X9X9T2_9BACT|nr:CPBP family intramembrane glutamic endopeptidase [Flammeovirga aprica]NME69056.1 CPBP family intramembrane metalloprotease [Flammeovirga aprica JL-4]
MKNILLYLLFLLMVVILLQLFRLPIDYFLKDYNLAFTIAEFLNICFVFAVIYKLNWLQYIKVGQVEKHKLIIYGCIAISVTSIFCYFYGYNFDVNIENVNLSRIIGGLVFAPLLEEVVFRGIATEYLERKGIKVQYRVIFTTVCFGLIHFPFRSIVDIQFFVIGLILALIYEKERNLVYCFLFHALVNLTFNLLAS